MARDEHFNTKRILVLDHSDKMENDRTWCFWSNHDYGFRSSQIQWQQIAFQKDKEKLQEDIHPFKYYHIEGKNFYREAFQFIDRSDHIDFERAAITNISDSENGVVVKTERNEYEGRLAFNSIIQFAFETLPDINLWQHFYGYRLQTKNPVFDAETVTLMDFSIGENKDRVQFGYVLPFNKNEALVEYTEFSPTILTQDDYQEEISDQITAMGIEEYEIKEIELGKIPMSYLPQSIDYKQVTHIGTAAGLTKPTTGYTFRNIQEDSKQIIASLKNGQNYVRTNKKQRFSFYDKLLLGIIRDEPHQVKKIMTKLFSRNKFKDILSFLDEKSSLWDEIRIFTSIPWGPFLRQLVKK